MICEIVGREPARAHHRHGCEGDTGPHSAGAQRHGNRAHSSDGGNCDKEPPSRDREAVGLTGSGHERARDQDGGELGLRIAHFLYIYSSKIVCVGQAG